MAVRSTDWHRVQRANALAPDPPRSNPSPNSLTQTYRKSTLTCVKMVRVFLTHVGMSLPVRVSLPVIGWIWGKSPWLGLVSIDYTWLGNWYTIVVLFFLFFFFCLSWEPLPRSARSFTIRHWHNVNRIDARGNHSVTGVQDPTKLIFVSLQRIYHIGLGELTQLTVQGLVEILGPSLYTWYIWWLS